MQVTSRLNNLRVAPRKVRLLANLIKGMPAESAVAELSFISAASAEPLLKLVKTALADAEHNFKLSKSDLMIKTVIVESAVTLKRYTPKAFGRAAEIRKRGSNVILTLADRPAPLAETEKPKVAKKKE